MNYYDDAVKPSNEPYVLASVNRDRLIRDDEVQKQQHYSDALPIGMFTLAVQDIEQQPK
jgi:hypothetical protein